MIVNYSAPSVEPNFPNSTACIIFVHTKIFTFYLIFC